MCRFTTDKKRCYIMNENLKLNSICLDCAKYGNGCNGTTQMHYTGCVYRDVKHKDPLTATKNFTVVKNYFLDSDGGTSHAYRLAWKKPMQFYRTHTPVEAIQILKQEAEQQTTI